MQRIKYCFIGIMLFLSACSQKPQKELLLSFKDIKSVEYGDVFDTKSLIESVDGNIVEYPVLDTQKVGKQILVFEVTEGDLKKSFDYEINVIDTNKPEIKLTKDKVEIDLKSKFDPVTFIDSVMDKVDGKIEYMDSKEIKEGSVHYYTYDNPVNLEKPGNYNVAYKAVDKNGNTSQATLQVIIKDGKSVEAIKPSETKPTQPTTKPSETKPTQPTTKPSETKPTQPLQSDYHYVLPSTVAKMKAARNVNKIVVVTSTNPKTRSGVAQYFVKSGDTWNEKLKVKCQLGKAGMGTGSEYSTRTPVGTYRFTHSYGIKANPGSRMPYTQINSHHYWCGDQYYNQFVDDTLKDHSKCSIDNDEHLINYPISYDYFASFSYNSSNTPGKGSAFFLHCINSKYSYTGGCVAVPKNDMIYLLKNIDTSTAFVIAQINNIQNY